MPSDYRPIVQVIDNLERDHKLGMIFELKVGREKLLVCAAQLNHLTQSPEAIQLYQSIVNYMNSPAFNPRWEVNDRQLEGLVGSTTTIGMFFPNTAPAA